MAINFSWIQFFFFAFSAFSACEYVIKILKKKQLGESNRKVCEESVKIIEILHQKNLILKDQNREFHDEYFLDIESKLSKLNFEELHSFTEVNEDQGKIVPEEILNHAHTCDNILDCY